MRNSLFLIVLVVFALCPGFGQKIGGPCEGCEAIHESPVPFQKLKPFVSLPDATWEGKKPLGINGVVYQADGKTPAAGVILYVYHTDETGHYKAEKNAKGWAKRHGSIRGWMRTNEKGEYKFVTLRPAPYPDLSEPAHIHLVVKEPGLVEYYLDDYVFDDDPLLKSDYLAKQPKRGGSGVIKLKDVGNMFKAERNIYLGQNIPNYPKTK